MVRRGLRKRRGRRVQECQGRDWKGWWGVEKIQNAQICGKRMIQRREPDKNKYEPQAFPHPRWASLSQVAPLRLLSDEREEGEKLSPRPFCLSFSLDILSETIESLIFTGYFIWKIPSLMDGRILLRKQVLQGHFAVVLNKSCHSFSQKLKTVGPFRTGGSKGVASGVKRGGAGGQKGWRHPVFIYFMVLH